MKKFIFSMKGLFVLIATVCLSFAFGGLSRVETKADTANNIQTKVEQIQTHNDGSMLMFFFNYEGEYSTDYMTAPWTPEKNETYHWYLNEATFGMAEEDLEKWDSLGGQLAYEDKDKYNMPNAILDKNLDAYNMGEYILIDGQPLSNYNYTLVANRWTRVHTLSIELVEPAFASITDLQIKAGCTLPTLTYSYFGEGEPSALVIEE